MAGILRVPSSAHTSKPTSACARTDTGFVGAADAARRKDGVAGGAGRTRGGVGTDVGAEQRERTIGERGGSRRWSLGGHHQTVVARPDNEDFEVLMGPRTHRLVEGERCRRALAGRR